MLLKSTHQSTVFAILSTLLSTGLGLLTWAGVSIFIMVYTQQSNSADQLHILNISLKTGFLLSISVLPLLFFYRNYNVKKSWFTLSAFAALFVISLNVALMAFPSFIIKMGIISGGLLCLSALGLITSLQLWPEPLNAQPQKPWWVSSHIIHMLLLGLVLFYCIMTITLKAKDINISLLLTIGLLQFVVTILNAIGWWESKKSSPWSGFWVFLSLVIIIPIFIGLLLIFSVISTTIALLIALTIFAIAYGISNYQWQNYYLSDNN